jgi:predicted Zn-dependent protease
VNPEQLQTLAAEVVERVAAERGAEADVVVERGELALTRFANSRIHQNVADSTLTIRLRVHLDGRTVTSSTGTAGDVAAFVAGVLDAVRVGPLDPGWPGLASPEPLAAPSPAHPASSPAERAATVGAFVAAVGGLEAAGYCREARTASAFANTAGHAVYAETAAATLDGIARDNGSDGVARLVADTVGELDGGALGRRAAAKARAAKAPRDLPPGRYEVLLEPCAVFDVLRNLAVGAFNGKLVTQQQSFIQVGTEQFDPVVTIVDDPLAAGVRFDNEGTPVQRTVLVDHGTSAAVAYDRRTAAEAGTASTGHDVGAGAFGPVPVFVGIEAHRAGAAVGAAPDLVDPSAAPLLAGVERGILVSDFWYTRVLDPKSLSITGLTRNGIWLVERGEIVAPLSNFRFTQAYAAALAPGAVRAVGPFATDLPDAWGGGRWRAPALHLASWNFTGGAAG